jgi:hypothetical protein
MTASVALNRLAKVEAVRASAEACKRSGDVAGFYRLRAAAARNELAVMEAMAATREGRIER